MPGFDADSAKRISHSVLYTERQQGIPSTDPNENYAANISSMCLVRTATTLPAGYVGTMAVQGDVIEKQPDGTVTTLGAVWIKDINGGLLSANTIYQARMGGTYAQDLTVSGITTPTTLALYLVQTTPTPTTYGYALGRYFGPPIIEAGTGIAYTAFFFEGYTGQRSGVIRTPNQGLAGIDTFLQSLASVGYFPPVLVKYTEQKAKFGDLIYSGPTISEVIPVALSQTIIQTGQAYGFVANPLGISGTNYMANFGYTAFTMGGSFYKWPSVAVLNAYPPPTSGISTGISTGISGV